MTKDLKDLYITLPPLLPQGEATTFLTDMNSLKQARQTFFKIFTTNFWLK